MARYTFLSASLDIVGTAAWSLPLLFASDRQALTERYLAEPVCVEPASRPGEALKLRAEELCFVGDRLLTDVVFGNLHGMLTVHTQPLSLEGDNRSATVFRFLERKVGGACDD